MNLPISFMNEYKMLESDYRAALVSTPPEGCDGRDESFSTKFFDFFSTSKIKDPCAVFNQRKVEPIYKISIVGVLSQSMVDVVGPAMKSFVKHLRYP